MTERTDKKRSRGRNIVLALAIALGAWVVLREREKPALPRDPDALTCVAPSGAVASVGRFEWSYVLPEGGSFELRLYDASYNVLGELPDLAETFYGVRFGAQQLTKQRATEIDRELSEWERLVKSAPEMPADAK